MSNNRGHHGVVPTITSVMIATYSITPLIGLLWLGITFLGVDSLFWLISSWSQLSIRKGQDLLISYVVILVLVDWLIWLELASQG